MATKSVAAHSETVCTNTNQESEETTLKLKLTKKNKERKKIQWTEDTVDNEGLGKKKSKCCCQYIKPRKDLDCSSSEEEEDCENCPGH